MSNYCFYTLKVKGIKENIEQFIRISKNELTNENFFRNFDVNSNWKDNKIDLEISKDLNFNGSKLYIDTVSGGCAWSVNSCFFTNGIDPCVTNLLIVSKKLNLEIEIFGEEGDFLEHYIVKNGDLILNSDSDSDSDSDLKKSAFKFSIA